MVNVADISVRKRSQNMLILRGGEHTQEFKEGKISSPMSQITPGTTSTQKTRKKAVLDKRAQSQPQLKERQLFPMPSC
jgi:hypothetical protein